MSATHRQRSILEAGLSALLCWLLCVGLGLTVGGCKPPPPPPPPPPAPPPPPPPPPLTEGEVAARLRPFFYVLYDRGFNPGTVDSSARWGVEYATRYALEANRQNTAASQSLFKAIDDSLAKTPSLRKLVERECAAAGIEPEPVVQWGYYANFTLPSQEAREILLNMYVLQAYKDADDGNLHRAHVLLRDVMGVMNEERATATNAGVESLRQFFLEVPDDTRLEQFARRLEDYISIQEEKILLHGEHAAVLNAAGLTDAAEFTRSKLVTQFDLITLPLINQAILRGESYGFRPPAQLQTTRRRLAAHAAALRESQPKENDNLFCTSAIWSPVDRSYLDQLRAFTETWSEDDGKAKPARTSVEKQVNELWRMKRPIPEWLREKTVCLKHSPNFLVNANAVSLAYLAAASPVIYQADGKMFSVDNFSRVLEDQKRLAAVVSWCKGNPLPAEINDGTGHFLLGWYWLESERPDLARAAFVAGAEHLLETVRAVDVEAMRVKAQENAKDLLRVLEAELNAYRLLMAASMITTCPPGAVNDSRDSYLPQLEVLLLGWKQSWLKCGFPQTPADEVIGRFAVAARENAIGLYGPLRDGGTALPGDRYFFYDYRFDHGPVPDIVVGKASADKMLENSALPELNKDGKLLSFMRSFQMPKEFTKGFAVRWRKEAGDKKPAEAE